MKALSIRQPWAWLIVNGFKDIENRKWQTQFRGRIYVQSGKRMVLDDFPEQRQYFHGEGIVIPENLTLGAIIGEVTITDCIEQSDNPWFCGPYGFVLKNPLSYETPIPYRGQLGLFEIQDKELLRV